MSRTRIHNLAISLDGFATREPQSTEAPFGHAGQRLHDWMFGTRFWARQGAPGGAADAGGSAGVDHAFAERHGIGFGAEIMGANKFGPPGWQDDPDWKGWWGPSRCSTRPGRPGTGPSSTASPSDSRCCSWPSSCAPPGLGLARPHRR